MFGNVPSMAIGYVETRRLGRLNWRHFFRGGADTLSAGQNAAVMVAGRMSSFLHDIDLVYAIPIFDAVGALAGAAWGTENIESAARAPGGISLCNRLRKLRATC